jgi:ElaB/YqjD/DUF883 family membrane-anchored ribosome-binding protein
MTSSARLEQEAEQTRSELAQTLDELRDRITPGQLVDQALDYAKDSGGAAFVRNLGRQTIDNPLPVTLIGAGLTWLILSNSSRAQSAFNGVKDAARNAAASVRRSGGDAKERVVDWTWDASTAMADAARDAMGSTRETRSAAAETAADVKSRLGETTSSIGEAGASLYEATKSRASEAYEQATDAANRATSAFTETADDLRQKTAGATKGLLQICTEQPLVLAGLGLAIGAIMGALIPSTETEDRLMGETSSQLKDKARSLVEEQMDNAKTATQGESEQHAHRQKQHSEAPLVPVPD